MKAANFIIQMIIVLFTLSICMSCNHSSYEATEPTFTSLECSYDGGWNNEDAFSIKIDNTGKLLLSNNRWEPRQYYQGKLSQKDLNVFFLAVKGAQFEKLDAYYIADQIPDKQDYNIWVTTLTHQLQKVQACGDSVPVKLELLRKSICLIQDTISLTRLNQKTLFATRTALYPTPPKTIKFTPPPEESEAQ